MKTTYYEVGGRFTNFDLQCQEKYTLLLRRHSHFTLLVVTETHHLVMHIGLEATLTGIRNRFWITRGRKTVKSILMKCVTCLQWQGKPMLPDLPAYQIISTHGFAFTGTDYADPLFVKGIYSKSSALNKCYICLFTCATSRAVHLELTPHMAKLLSFVLLND